VSSTYYVLGFAGLDTDDLANQLPVSANAIYNDKSLLVEALPPSSITQCVGLLCHNMSEVETKQKQVIFN
jgi:hypothetical protein